MYLIYVNFITINTLIWEAKTRYSVDFGTVNY